MPGIKKIDLYVARTFAGPFVLCCFAFVGLYVVIDFFSNIDQFLLHDSLFDTLRLTLRYYALVIPSYLSQTMPALVAVSAVLCMVRLQRGNELCAIRASGVSARRLSAPVIFCACAVMVLAAANQELVVPALHGPLLSAEREARQAQKRRIGSAHVVDRKGRFLMIGSYDPATSLPTLTKVRINWDDAAGGHHVKEGERAFAPSLGATWYMETVRQFDGRRTMLGAEVWERRKPESFTSKGTFELLKKYRGAADRVTVPLIVTDKEPSPVSYEFGSYSESDEQWPVAREVEIIHPSDPGSGRLRIGMMVWVGDRWRMFGAWRLGKMDPATRQLKAEPLPDGETLDDSIGLSEIQASEFRRASSMMTLSELADRGSTFTNRKYCQRCWVTIWRRVAFPFASVVLVLLALPIVIRQGTHTGIAGVSMAVLVTFAYMLADFVSVDLGNSEWLIWGWPFFAGVFPTLLFAFVAVWLFVQMDEV